MELALLNIYKIPKKLQQVFSESLLYFCFIKRIFCVYRYEHILTRYVYCTYIEHILYKILTQNKKLYNCLLGETIDEK